MIGNVPLNGRKERRRNQLAQITYKDIKKSKEINAYIDKGNTTLGVLGYTDHSAVPAVKGSEKSWSVWIMPAAPWNWQRLRVICMILETV